MMTEATKGYVASQEKLLRKAGMFREVFSTEAGKQVLHAIQQEFGTYELTDPYESTRIIVRAAQRDVVDYIERMVRHAENHQKEV
jgi:hypothetical protein